MIKKWWRPEKFTVTYCLGFGMLQDHHDKFDYDNIEDAKNRMNYLSALSGDDLLSKEGFDFVPNYIRIEQVTGPNPIRRLLNRLGSKRVYTIFGLKTKEF